MDFRRFLEAELEEGVRSLGEFSSFCLNTVLWLSALEGMDPSGLLQALASDEHPVKQTNGSGAHQSLDGLATKPINRIWRGDKAGTLKLHNTRPHFDNPYDEREWIKEHLAGVFRFWGKRGFGEGVGGHITVRDPVLPGHYWMNPMAVHFSLIKKSNLVLVDEEGHVSPHGAQLPINAAGYHIHSAIHKARPDVQAAMHCHSIYGRTWSVFGRPIDMLTQDACNFYNNLSVYDSFGGIVLAQQEGENIAKALGPHNKSVILQNHGLLTLGTTVDEAAHYFAALEKCCQGQLAAEAAAANGIKIAVIGDEEAAFTAATLQDPEVVYLNFQPEYELLLEETNGAFLR